MQENVKISKIDKKKKQTIKKNFFLLKKLKLLYLLDKRLKMKVHKMLERVKRTFMFLLLCRSNYSSILQL